MKVYYRQRHTDITYLIGLGISTIFYLGVMIFCALILKGDLRGLVAGVALIIIAFNIVIMGLLSQRVTVITGRHIEHGAGIFRRRYPLDNIRTQQRGSEMEVTLATGQKLYIAASDQLQQALTEALSDYGKNV